MKIYTFYTDSHSEMFDKWFLPSFKGHEIIAEKHKQYGKGNFMDDGWMKTMANKIKLIQRAIYECKNDEIFVHSDVDIQQIRPFEDHLLKFMGDAVFAAQEDSPGELCAGFFICRGGKEAASIWDKIPKWVENNKGLNDQHGFNALIKKSKVKYRLLPKDMYFSPRKLWKPGQLLKIPSNVMVHHANWTIGVKAKIAQLKYVRDKLNDL